MTTRLLQHALSIGRLPFRYKPWKPLHLRILISDFRGKDKQPRHADEKHLAAVIAWLCLAQDQRIGQSDEGGVSAGWSFEDGWLPSYPETSGYIVETFLAASTLLSDPDLKNRAQRILDWELSIQDNDGSFPGHFGEHGSKPVIFNTGQIMHGLIAGFEQLHKPECLEAAVRAGRWMLGQQDEDGCWRRSVHNDTPHTYNTRAAWALLKTGLAANDKKLEKAAIKNIEWALAQQTENGWFKNNAFVPDTPPFTHTIAYAIRGILESGLLIDNRRMIKAAVKAAKSQAERQRNDGWLAGTYDEHWMPQSRYCCLTGLAQMCLIWFRIARAAGESNLEESAVRGIDYIKSNHRIIGTETTQKGGITGSSPIWGRYSMFEYPNWAAKFFADALMMNMSDISIPNYG